MSSRHLLHHDLLLWPWITTTRGRWSSSMCIDADITAACNAPVSSPSWTKLLQEVASTHRPLVQMRLLQHTYEKMYGVCRPNTDSMAPIISCMQDSGRQVVQVW